jgi:membrane fusion protein (multidrug efflux system)
MIQNLIKYKKLKIFFVFFIIFSQIFISTSSFSSPVSIKVKIIHPEQKIFSKKLFLPAECKSLKSKDYIAQSPGTIDYVADQKAKFYKGDLILAIDKAHSDAVKEYANLNFKSASSSYERDKQLFTKKIISDERLEQSKLLFLTAKERYEDTLKQLESKLITAPFDGYISTIKYKLGEKIKAGDFLVNIISGHEKFISFVIPNSYKVDADYTIANAIYNNSVYLGKKLNISKILSDDKIGYPSNFIIDAPNSLEHNSYITAKISYDNHKAFGVPESCVFIDDGKHYIYYVDEKNIAKKLEIQTGEREESFIEVLSKEINKDFKIVFEGIQKLEEGQPVEIIE